MSIMEQQLKQSVDLANKTYAKGYEIGFMDGKLEAYREVLALMEKNKPAKQAG